MMSDQEFSFSPPYSLTYCENGWLLLVKHGVAIASFSSDFGSIKECIEAAWRYAYEPHDEITRLRAQLAAAEADRLAFGERVRDAAANIVERNGHSLHIEILALDLDALAEGEK